ncbi:hypothetical protein [Arthrobacter sp. CAN_A212]|uniref:hypothetical protein n=1 Tax=Arthrobacter sp. CAN_A212 TaxID=2787719 RepID=UPI002FF12831
MDDWRGRSGDGRFSPASAAFGFSGDFIDIPVRVDHEFTVSLWAFGVDAHRATEDTGQINDDRHSLAPQRGFVGGVDGPGVP